VGVCGCVCGAQAFPGCVFILMAMDRGLHDAVLDVEGVGCFVGRKVPGKGIIPNPLRMKEVRGRVRACVCVRVYIPMYVQT
jgi:hypothetical protein